MFFDMGIQNNIKHVLNIVNCKPIFRIMENKKKYTHIHTYIHIYLLYYYISALKNSKSLF